MSPDGAGMPPDGSTVIAIVAGNVTVPGTRKMTVAWPSASGSTNAALTGASGSMNQS